jgi:hypothetical protein
MEHASACSPYGMGHAKVAGGGALAASREERLEFDPDPAGMELKREAQLVR